jgi:hypothetical protein
MENNPFFTAAAGVCATTLGAEVAWFGRTAMSAFAMGLEDNRK